MNGQVQLTSLVGDVVMLERINNANSLELNLEQFSTGFYVLKIYDKDMLIGQEKIIKQ